MKIPMIKPDVWVDEANAVFQATMEGEIGPGSKYVAEFEEKLAKYLKKKYVVTCNSGYSSILLACRAVKEIYGVTDITLPAFTMIATGAGAKHAGLNLHFMDVNNRGQLEGHHEDVMTVDIYGNQSPATGNIVIEDAAEYFGPFKFRGLVTCFSLNINKSLTTGVGGICATDDESLAKEMGLLRFHYFEGFGGKYYHERAGYNLSMSGLQAALGIEQLKRVDEILEKRKVLGERYVKKLPKAWKCETYWYQPYLCDSHEEKERLKIHLEKNDIACRDFFPPITNNPPFADGKKYPVAEDLYARGLLLPVYSTMTDEEQTFIINTIKQLDDW